MFNCPHREKKHPKNIKDRKYREKKYKIKINKKYQKIQQKIEEEYSKDIGKCTSMEGNICKYFMYGYCNPREHCSKQHIDGMCPNYR